MKVLSSAVPSLDKFSRVEDDNFPGELIFGSGNIMINKGRKAVKIKVVNKADRPIQVSSFNCLKFSFLCIFLSVLLLNHNNIYYYYYN